MQWSAFGPFTFQTSRFLHYLVYFLIAVALGSQPFTQTMLDFDGKLRRRWPLWATSAMLAFLLFSFVSVAAITSHTGSKPWAMFANFTFALSCCSSCFALLALSLRVANRRRRFLDSLSDNAYGIYLLHYSGASWLQFALLSAPLPAIAKGITVTTLVLVASWIASAGLRRIPSVARIV